MNTIIQSLKIINVLILALSTLACTTTTQRAVEADPNVRLQQLLSTYQEMQVMGDGCRELWQQYSAVVDCQRLDRELAELHVQFPGHAHILFSNAVVAYDLGRLDKAQNYLDQIDLLRQSFPAAAAMRIELAVREGNLNLATQLVEAQTRMSPAAPLLREAAASIAYLRQDYAAAADSLAIAGRLGSPGWRISYHHGLLAEAQQNWPQACDLYALSLQQQPDFSAAQSRLIGLLSKPGCERALDAIN